ncbi:hypothetical protein WN943_007357 [Citrus x changshan-huyou]
MIPLLISWLHDSIGCSRHQLIPEIHRTVQHKMAQKLPERQKFTNPITETQKRDSP